MDLILWRHAEALDASEGMDDMDRGLTRRGEKQALRIGQWLDRQLPEGVRVLCSPARRTEQTVLALGRKFKIREELGPGGDPAELLRLAQWPDGKSTVLVVGHQPMLGQVIAGLLSLGTGGFPVKKGAVWWLRSRQRGSDAQTLVVTVQSPELL